MSLNEPTTINSGSMKPQEHPRVSRKPKRRGKRGDIHIYKPLGSTTYWINFSAPGKGRKRSNTGKQTEADARIFAAEVGRMVGLANSDDLDDQRRLLEIARELLGGLPALEHEAAHITATKNLPTVRECFTRELTAMSHNTTGDDRHLKADSITRVADVVNDFVIFLSEQSVNLADAPLNRIGSEHVRGFLDDLKKKGYSGKTRLFARDRIRAMLGHAVDKGLLPVNPASVKQIGRLKFDTSSIRKGFNEKQISAIFNAAAKSPEKWLSRTAMLALFTGQRAGDICAMQWDNIKDFDGLLPTITITQIKTGVTVVIPIATPLHRLLKAIPRAERTGYIIDEQVAAGYAGKYRNIFNRPWRALLNGLDLADMADIPTVAKVEGKGTHGRTRYAWSFHSFRHTTASYLNGPDAHYLLGHRTAEEKRLGTTVLYRHSDLNRLKAQLNAIPLRPPDNVMAMPTSTDSQDGAIRQDAIA